jgi:hypothetical protein
MLEINGHTVDRPIWTEIKNKTCFKQVYPIGDFFIGIRYRCPHLLQKTKAGVKILVKATIDNKKINGANRICAALDIIWPET